jgi:SAM-dependent methyltransferase
MRLFADWQDAAFAAEWMARDVLKDLLDLPRRIASIVVGQDRTPARVADIGSGPGDFLARFLEDFPAVHGTWTDASDAMMQTARARLARFGDRVDYRIIYMEDLAALPDDLDVVLTSRVTHHLSPGGLVDFYAAAAAKLAPGGWLVNLDHMGVHDTWEVRLKSARRALIPPSPRPGEHPHVHDQPRPSVAANLDGLRRAGFGDVAVPWSAFVTALLMARRAG